MKNNGWKSYLCLEIVEKNEQICTVKFQNVLGAMLPDPHTGYGAPPQTPCLARGKAPSIVPLCVQFTF